MKTSILFFLQLICASSVYSQSILLDIGTSSQSSYPRYGVDVNGTLYFTAGHYNDSNVRIWKTDGLTVNTTQIDVNAGSPITGPVPQYYNSKSVTAFGNKALIIASTAQSNFDQELWISDGTNVGTFRLADINPGLGDPYITGLTVVTLGGVTKALF